MERFHKSTGDHMKNDDFEFRISPIISSLFDDIEHRILSPLSCLREFDSHWILEFDLPLVSKKDVKALWGTPKEVSNTVTEYGNREQWRYKDEPNNKYK